MTPRQKEVFDFIQSYISNRGFAPTYTEIMQATSVKYRSQCFGLLKNLEQQGKITIDKAKARGISICNKTKMIEKEVWESTLRQSMEMTAKSERLEKQLAIALEVLGLIDKRKCHMANCLQNCPLRKYYEKYRGCATCLNNACHTALQQIEELNK